jgi:hypothetical protein
LLPTQPVLGQPRGLPRDAPHSSGGWEMICCSTARQRWRVLHRCEHGARPHHTTLLPPPPTTLQRRWCTPCIHIDIRLDIHSRFPPTRSRLQQGLPIRHRSNPNHIRRMGHPSQQHCNRTPYPLYVPFKGTDSPEEEDFVW